MVSPKAETAGGDRQDLHEAIRTHSMDAGARVKGEGASNDLLDRIRQDERFIAVHNNLESLLDPVLFVGRAPQQTEEFVDEVINPILSLYDVTTIKTEEVNV